MWIIWFIRNEDKNYDAKTEVEKTCSSAFQSKSVHHTLIYIYNCIRNCGAKKTRWEKILQDERTQISLGNFMILKVKLRASHMFWLKWICIKERNQNSRNWGLKKLDLINLLPKNAKFVLGRSFNLNLSVILIIWLLP